MIDKEKVNKAIGAHGMWKARLRTAIDLGASEFKPDIVATDNNCEFGKWLYSDPELKTHVDFNNIKVKHAAFHKEASKILTLALGGKKDDAKKLMEVKSPFSTLSCELTALLMNLNK